MTNFKLFTPAKIGSIVVLKARFQTRKNELSEGYVHNLMIISFIHSLILSDYKIICGIMFNIPVLQIRAWYIQYLNYFRFGNWGSESEKSIQWMLFKWVIRRFRLRTLHSLLAEHTLYGYVITIFGLNRTGLIWNGVSHYIGLSEETPSILLAVGICIEFRLTFQKYLQIVVDIIIIVVWKWQTSKSYID